MARGIELLHPEMQEKALQFQSICNKHGFNVLITETLRSTAEQDALYAKGRTTPGKIVTKCEGSKFESAHQWGVAFDFCKNMKGQEYGDDAFFRAVGAVGKSIGLSWGGDFKSFVDLPHFELPKYMPGNSTATLKKQYMIPANFIKTWGDYEMVSNTDLLVNGKRITVERILKDDTNYVKLRDLAAALGAAVDWDAVQQLPVIKTK